MLAASLIVGYQPGLIPSPHLAHLDSRFKRPRQLPHQLAKIHPLLGHEVERQQLFAEDQLNLDELHGQR